MVVCRLKSIKFKASVLAVVALCVSAIYGQLPSQLQTEARTQVVMVTVGPSGCAGGIIVGFDSDAVYVATAAHIIDDLSVNPLPPVSVRFNGLSGDSRVGTIAKFDPPAKGDLALIRVKLDPALSAFLSKLDFRIVSPVPLPANGSPVTSIGCSGLTWWNSGNKETLLPADQNYLWFHSDVDQGQSGGALYTEAWELVGMPLRANGNIVSARPIESILQRLREPDWDVPVKLAPRAMSDRIRGPDELAREKAAVAESQELARLASESQQSDIWKAAETAVRAMKRSETEAARATLDEVLRNILRRRTGDRILRVDPSGKYLAFASGDGQSFVLNIQSGERTEICGQPERIIGLQFSPSGALLLAKSSWVTQIWDIGARRKAGTVDGLPPGRFEQDSGVWFSADEKRLVTFGFDSRANLWELPGGRRIAEMEETSGGVENRVIFDPLHPAVLVFEGSGMAINVTGIWNTQNGRRLWALSRENSHFEWAAYRGSKMIAFTSSGVPNFNVAFQVFDIGADGTPGNQKNWTIDDFDYGQLAGGPLGDLFLRESIGRVLVRKYPKSVQCRDAYAHATSNGDAFVCSNYSTSEAPILYDLAHRSPIGVFKDWNFSNSSDSIFSPDNSLVSSRAQGCGTHRLEDYCGVFLKPYTKCASHWTAHGCFLRTGFSIAGPEENISRCPVRSSGLIRPDASRYFRTLTSLSGMLIRAK